MEKLQLVILLIMIFVSPTFGTWSDIVIDQSTVFDESNKYINVEVQSNIPEVTILEIVAGQIGSLFIYNSSEVIIRGGEINSEFYSFHPENNDGDNVFYCPPENTINVCDMSHLYLYGGSISGSIMISENAVTDIYGYNFELSDRNELTGFWQDGTQFSFRLADDSVERVSLHIIPEPLSISLFAVGYVFIKRKRKYRSVLCKKQILS